MKKKYSLILALALKLSVPLVLSAQITVSDLTNLNRTINTPYLKNRSQIDGIIKSYIKNGFILVNFESQSDNNSLSNHFFTLQRVQGSGSSENIIINSFLNDYTRASQYVIEFNTTDFLTYSKWFTTLFTTPDSYKEKENNHFELIYEYSNSKISIGTKYKTTAGTSGPITTYEMSLNPTSPVYYISITSNYLK